MADNAQLPIPKEILEPYLKQAVSASIMQLMGDNGMTFVAAAVQNSLQQKVDSNGRASNYSSDAPYVEWLAKNTIQKIALETINGMAEQLRPSIEDAVKKSLQKNNSALAKALVDGMVKSLSSQWSVSIKVSDSD